MALVRSPLWNRALGVIPGGVNSPVRAMRGVGLDEPFFVARGDGAYIETTDGRRLLDWVQSWGPLIFGHADEEVVEAVRLAALDGTTFGAPTENEVELAAEIVDAVPSVERVRLVSSGTEAAMSAVRLARGVTRRDRVITFAGCYHGHADQFLARAGSGLATLGIPSSPGVPSGVTADTIVCEYNDVDGVAAAVARYGEGLAAILVEPIAGNMGCVPPAPGFLEALRLLCDASGALLVFDEVISGFRVARGGAQERLGVTPDLTVLGKIVGGGLPLAAFGGRAEVMDELAPAGSVYQAGTLSGNPLATAAGLIVLRRLRDPAVYELLEERSARLEQGLAPFGRVQRVGAMLTLFAGRDAPVERFEELDTDAYGTLFRGLLERGVYVAPSQYECLFPSVAHGDDADRAHGSGGGGCPRSLSRSPTAPRAESNVWAASLRSAPDWEPVFSLLSPPALAVGIETIYEAYLCHYGEPRLFDPPDGDDAVLLGDYLYAHGLVRDRGCRRCARGRGARGADLALRGPAGRRAARRRRGVARRRARARRHAVGGRRRARALPSLR